MHVTQCIAVADEQHQQQHTQYKLIPTWYASSHCALTCLVFCLGCCGDTRVHTLCTAHTKCTLDSALHQTCAWWPGRSLVVESQPACQGLQRRGVGVGSATLQQSQYASCTGQVLAGATWAIAPFHSSSHRRVYKLLSYMHAAGHETSKNWVGYSSSSAVHHADRHTLYSDSC